MVTNKKVRLTLVGSDGNAFAVLGRFQRAAKAQGWTPEAVRRVTLDATSGDYSHLLATIMKHTTETRAMTTDLVNVLPTEEPPPKPKSAWKVRCPYCGGTGWRDTGDGGGWKCFYCAGAGWIWTDGGAG